MPDQLIPRLSQLVSYPLNRPGRALRQEFPQETRLLVSLGLPTGFVEHWHTAHAGNWNQAEEHWERLVERTLKTDAIDKYASPERAVHQAVAATVILLSHSSVRYQCLLCPHSTPARSPLRLVDADDQAAAEGSSR
jgi:hypothetical protein